MPKLFIYRGLPASGKTTAARDYQRQHKGTKIVNKDSLRLMLDDGVFNRDNEAFVLRLRDLSIEAALSGGFDVISDDTNLATKHCAHLQLLAQLHGATAVTVDFTQVPLDECIKRDRKRQHYVGEKVIRQMHRQYIADKPAPVEYNAAWPNCYIFDLDGTLADMGNRRTPYEMDKIHLDANKHQIVTIYSALRGVSVNAKFLIVTGRDNAYREPTMQWLNKHGIEYDLLFMRPQGDRREDSEVKREIFEHLIKGQYNVLAVFDDRQRVVDMWRSLGLTCLQVADGDF